MKYQKTKLQQTDRSNPKNRNQNCQNVERKVEVKKKLSKKKKKANSTETAGESRRIPNLGRDRKKNGGTP